MYFLLSLFSLKSLTVFSQEELCLLQLAQEGICLSTHTSFTLDTDRKLTGNFLIYETIKKSVKNKQDSNYRYGKLPCRSPIFDKTSMVILANLKPELSEAAEDPKTVQYTGIFIAPVIWLGAVCEKLSESL